MLIYVTFDSYYGVLKEKKIVKLSSEELVISYSM